MATLDWPAAFRPSRMSWGAITPRTAWAAAYTGQTQSVSHAGDRLRVTVELPPALPPLAAEREAFFMEVASAGHWLRLHNFTRPQPRGTARGSVTVSSNAAAGARTIALAGALASPNLITGSSFEIDTNSDGRADGWSEYWSGTLSGVSYNRAPGLRSTWAQRIAADSRGAGTGDQVGIYYTSFVAVEVGASYTLSADVIANYTNFSIRLYINWYDESNVSVGNSSQTFAAPGAWTRINLTGVAPAGAVKARVYVWQQGAGVAHSAPGPHIYVDNVQFQRGSVATPYAGFATLLAGDMLAASGQLVSVGHAGAVANDAGAFSSVPLVLPLRAGLSSAAAVTWDRPTATFQLLGMEPMVTYGPAGVQTGLELTLAEVFA